MPAVTPFSKVALAAAALSLGLAGYPVSQAGAESPADTQKQQASKVGPQATSATAMASAKSSGHRVEDLSKRTETIQSFANPDGSWTQETATEPVRSQDPETGRWSSIDLTLEAVDGGFAPKSALGELLIPNDGSSTFAELTVQDSAGQERQMSWRWSGPLPTPEIENDTATYRDVVDNGDLVVTASSTGFRHDIVLREAPADPLSFDLPVITQGSRVIEDGADNTFAVTTRSGEELVTAAPPVMYDSSTDATGEPNNVVPLDAVVTPRSGGSTMTLRPDDGFLSDPTTEYPVTIDPQWNIDPSADTWTSNQQPTTNYASSADLRVGTFNSGTNKTRSYIHFAKNTPIPYRGARVLSAAINIRNFESATCAGGQIHINRITSDWFADQVTWSNQGNIGVTGAGTSISSQAFGASGCSANWMSWDTTAMAQDWANGAPNYGVRVIALQETNNNSWRKFRSANSSDPAYYPRLVVNYTFPPYAPSNLAASPTEDGVVGSVNPTLSALVRDPDAGQGLRAQFTVYNSASQVVWSGAGSWVENGGTSTAPMPTGTLNSGDTYTLEAVTSDGFDVSPAARTSFTVADPVAITGVLYDIDQIAADELVINIGPDTASRQAATEGQVLASYSVPQESVKISGNRFSVRFDPRDVPAEFIDDDGRADFEVYFTDSETGTTATTGSTVRRAASGTDWIDAGRWVVGDAPASTATPSDAPVDSSDAPVAMEDEPYEVGQIVEDPAADTTPPADAPGATVGATPSQPSDVCDGPCPSWGEPTSAMTTTQGSAAMTTQRAARPRALTGIKGRKQVEAVIGTTYPVGGEKAWLSYGQNSATTLGIGASTGPGGFRADGTRSVTSGLAHEFTKSAVNKSYRIIVEYEKWQSQNPVSGWYFVQWKPGKPTGGTAARQMSSDRPNWTKCTDVAQGTWSRTSSTGGSYSLGTGVKIANTIGIDLSSKKEYSQGVTVNYTVTTNNKQMCGNNDFPARSSKMMMRFKP